MIRSFSRLCGVILLGLFICTVFLCGCTGNSGNNAGVSGTDSTNLQQDQARGDGTVLTVTGSTTVLPVAAQAAEQFMEKHPDVDVQVNGGGSGVGVQSTGEGTAMIGMSSRNLKPEEKEKYPEIREHQIAIDGIAIITHQSNQVPSLTLDQIRGIYNGSITNWKDVGGNDAKIVVIGRDSASGTREFFQEKIMEKEDFVRTQLEKNSNGAVKQSVEQTPAAVGYVGLGYIDNSIHAVPVIVGGKQVVPSVATVKDNTYPIARPLNMLTKGEPAGQAAAFLSYLESPEGQKIVTDEGFVPLTR